MNQKLVGSNGKCISLWHLQRHTQPLFWQRNLCNLHFLVLIVIICNYAVQVYYKFVLCKNKHDLCILHCGKDSLLYDSYHSLFMQCLFYFFSCLWRVLQSCEKNNKIIFFFICILYYCNIQIIFLTAILWWWQNVEKKNDNYCYCTKETLKLPSYFTLI